MIRLESLTKTFETEHGTITAVDRVSLEVPEGEVCILLGPSGCGKTTTLKMINRLVSRTSGKVFINNRDTDDHNTVELRRSIGYVIQQIGLFPNMTIEENIVLVPDLLGWKKKRARERARELMEMVALDQGLLKRYPSELSGGQQQRVGVIRALAADAPVMLMDEPFGAIDPINRQIIQDEFLKMQSKLKKTIMFVSHDINEAIKMGDRVAIFRGGEMEQYSPPDELLANPVNDFVSDFVGSDRTLKRLRLSRVEDALLPSAPTVEQNDTLDHAKNLIVDWGHHAIVMIDRAGRPRGYIELTMAERESGQISDSYSLLAVTVKLEDDLWIAASHMFTYNLDWLAVVDDDGHFKGYITQTAIANLLSGARVRDAGVVR